MVRSLLLALSILLSALLPASAAEMARGRLEVQTAAGARHGFTVEIARSFEERARGLMFRQTLAPDAGMLFDFGMTEDVAMWMKNTLIPLDMLFITEDGRVVNIAQRTVPHSLEPVAGAEPVRYVLELGGGVTARLGIRPGDRVFLPKGP